MILYLLTQTGVTFDLHGKITIANLHIIKVCLVRQSCNRFVLCSASILYCIVSSTTLRLLQAVPRPWEEEPEARPQRLARATALEIVRQHIFDCLHKVSSPPNSLVLEE